MNNPNEIPYVFWFVVFAIGSCCFIDQYFCKPIIKRLRNNPQIFTPTHAPTNPPDSPASDTDSIDDLPSPATMKPDYSSGEDYVDIYREYIRSNSHDPESP